jgi:hypothetical protein
MNQIKQPCPKDKSHIETRDDEYFEARPAEEVGVRVSPTLPDTGVASSHSTQDRYEKETQEEKRELWTHELYHCVSESE